MSKKKSRRRVIKTIIPKVATVFDCPFCNHKKCVEVKMYFSFFYFRDNKKQIANISCRVCTSNFKTKKTALTDPIDVYSEWIDECERINKEEN